MHERRERLGHIVEDAFALSCSLMSSQPEPDLTGRVGDSLTEDVRMPALTSRGSSGPARDCQPLVPEALGRGKDLEQQVAELVEQLLVAPGQRGVRDLVGLLGGVRDDRRRGLLAVPRAVAPEALGQRLQLDQRVRESVSRRRSGSGRVRLRRRVADLVRHVELVLQTVDPLAHLLRLLLAEELLLDRLLDLRKRRGRGLLDLGKRLDDVQPYCVLIGCESSFLSSENAALSNSSGTVGLRDGQLAALALRAGIFGERLRQFVKLPPASSCAWIWSAFFFVLTRMCRTSRSGQLVLRLVLGVEALDFLVADL